MKMPEVRKKMLEVASKLKRDGLTLRAREIEALVAEMYRRSPIRKERTISARLTKSQRQDIRSAWDGTDKSMQALSVRYNVNIGRISEIVRGFRR